MFYVPKKAWRFGTRQLDDQKLGFLHVTREVVNACR